MPEDDKINALAIAVACLCDGMKRLEFAMLEGNFMDKSRGVEDARKLRQQAEKRLAAIITPAATIKPAKPE